MNKFYFFATIILVPCFSQSQPTLTEANCSPQIGESVLYTQISWDGTAPSLGASQNWDYSGLTGTGTATFSFDDPSTCPSPSSFPNATIVWNAANVQYDYSKYSSTAYERVGSYAGGVAMPLTDSETLLTYPFTYNDTYVDDFNGTFVNGVTWNRIGDVTVTGVGYGTLMLPNSTLTNILCVKVTEDYGDWTGGTETYHYDIDIYMFYKPGFPIPVLALTHYQQGSTIVNYGNFVDDADLGTNDNKHVAISVYPNPANSQLFINSNNTIFDKVEIYDVVGALVFASQGQTNSIDIAAFESGIYFLNLWVGDKKETIKFVKE